MSALKALGDSVGVSFADGVAGVLGTDFAPVVKTAANAPSQPEVAAS
jgi:hypothetical protein